MAPKPASNAKPQHSAAKALDKAYLARCLAAINGAADGLAPLLEHLRPRVQAGADFSAPMTSESYEISAQVGSALLPLKALADYSGPSAEDHDPITALRWVGQLNAQLERLADLNAPPAPGVIKLAASFDPRPSSIPAAGWTAALAARLAAALDSVGPERLRRCEICQSLFLAPRGRSAACSRRCNNTLRQRVFYEREKRRIEITTQLLSEKKDARAIARRLGVPIARARAYIVRAREKHDG